MPELIDKKRTEAKVFLLARHFIDRPDCEVELVKAVIHRCCEEIDKQPTIEAEAEPVRHGRWIPYGRDSGYNSFIRCSHCNHEVVMYADSEKSKPKYCEECGYRMDGGADNG